MGVRGCLVEGQDKGGVVVSKDASLVWLVLGTRLWNELQRSSERERSRETEEGRNESV